MVDRDREIAAGTPEEEQRSLSVVAVRQGLERADRFFVCCATHVQHGTQGESVKRPCREAGQKGQGRGGGGGSEWKHHMDHCMFQGVKLYHPHV